MKESIEKAEKQKQINIEAYNDVISGTEPTSKDEFYLSCYRYWYSIKHDYKGDFDS